MAVCLLSLAVVGLVDYLTADDLVLTLLYLLPLSMGAWVARSFGLVLAVAGAAVYGANETIAAAGHVSSVLILNTVFEGVVFAGVALVLSSLKTHQEGERNARAVAEEALANVRQLSALLPMCSSCKKIRHEPDGSWEPFEVYLLTGPTGLGRSSGGDRQAT